MRTPLTLWMPLCLAALLLFSTTAAPSVFIIEPDGTGDVATIQDAVHAAADGDTVLLADGTFTGDGNRDVSYLGKAVRIRSLSGDAASCIIDLEGGPGSEHRAFVFASGEGGFSILRNVTIRNGYVGLYHAGGAVYCDNSHPTITGVTFENCSAGQGGAIALFDYACPHVGACGFIDCTARDGSGGAVYAPDSDGVFQSCTFSGNTAIEKGGAVWTSRSEPQFSSCVFVDNECTGNGLVLGGGAVHMQACWYPVVWGCTFFDNRAPRGGALLIHDTLEGMFVNNTFAANGADWGTSVYIWKSTPEFYLTIFAFDRPGTDAVHCAELADPSFYTCCVFGNASGDSLCGTMVGVFHADPLFCDLASGDLTLHENSPCLPEHPYEELVGAHWQGCGYSAVEKLSWGAIKAMYR